MVWPGGVTRERELVPQPLPLNSVEQLVLP